MKSIILAVSLCGLLFTNIFSQTIATFEIELRKDTQGLDVPVQVNLSDITFLPDSVLNLVKVENAGRIPVPSQIRNGESRSLHWIISAQESGKLTYELVRGRRSADTEMTRAQKEDGLLVIQTQDKKLLGYQYGIKYPPAGVDSAYGRSGFIHPLWTPHGQVLTRIQPPDHYHHYGLWNPWTRVLFEADTVDFWNLREKQGTVRFANFVETVDGPVFSEYQALHEHVVFKSDGHEKVALNELQTIRVYRPVEDYYVIDFSSKMNCAGESPFRILKYRYQGLGLRATEVWNDDNSEVLTSEGKTRADADNTSGRWYLVQGELGDDYGGLLMLSHPANYSHPEPMRVWPPGTHEGSVYANFVPAKNEDWLLEPGKTYTLKYRMLIFNGRFSKEKAEAVWQNYAKTPEINVTKH